VEYLSLRKGDQEYTLALNLQETALAKIAVVNAIAGLLSHLGEPMRAEIILKYEEKERLLAKASRKSPARSVLNRARPKSNHPQLVTITCDEQGAAAILEVAQRHYGSTWRVMKSQMKRLGLLKSIYNAR
jgi:hypothetical protein